MNKIFLILFIGIFLISFASAEGIGKICVDLDPPTWPENSSLSLIVINGNNIQLTWTAATDIPSCSGIDHYNIYRSTDGTTFPPIGISQTNTYTDSGLLSGKTYYYIIHAEDLVGHNESLGISNTITLGVVSPPPSGGGGGGAITYWECGEWGDCINGTQERICTDIHKLELNRTETRGCFPEFIPTGQKSEVNETITSSTTTPGFFAGITGAVIGALGTGGSIAVLVFVVLVVLLAVLAARQSKVEAKAEESSSKK